jgi:hypothetical protein
MKLDLGFGDNFMKKNHYNGEGILSCWNWILTSIDL